MRFCLAYSGSFGKLNLLEPSWRTLRLAEKTCQARWGSAWMEAVGSGTSPLDHCPALLFGLKRPPVRAETSFILHLLCSIHSEPVCYRFQPITRRCDPLVARKRPICPKAFRPTLGCSILETITTSQSPLPITSMERLMKLLQSSEKVTSLRCVSRYRSLFHISHLAVALWTTIVILEANLRPNLISMDLLS